MKQATTTTDMGWDAAATEGKEHFGKFSLGHFITTIAVYSSVSSSAKRLLFHTTPNLVISEDACQSGAHVNVFSFHPLPQPHQVPRRRCSAGST